MPLKPFSTLLASKTESSRTVNAAFESGPYSRIELQPCRIERALLQTSAGPLHLYVDHVQVLLYRESI